MSYLDEIVGISNEPYNNFTVIMGKPGSGKTTLAGSYPKPMLVVTVGDDGGAVVLKHYGDDEIKTLNLVSDDVSQNGGKHVGIKVKELMNELKDNKTYKTVVIDAYSSIEEEIVTYISKKKGGKRVSLEERGSIMSFIITLRDDIVRNSKKDIEYVAIVHVKTSEDTDNISGEKNINLIPKMTLNNGNILLERASNVMYCARKTVKENGENVVKFLTYIGAHPFMDTKIRFEDGRRLDSGIYIENATYDKVEKIKSSGVTKEDKVEIVENTNPFEEKEDNKGDEF